MSALNEIFPEGFCQLEPSGFRSPLLLSGDQYDELKEWFDFKVEVILVFPAIQYCI